MTAGSVLPAPKGKFGVWFATHKPEAIAGGALGLVGLVIVKNKMSASAKAAALAAVPTTSTIQPAATYTDTSSGNQNFEDQLSALNEEIAKVAAQAKAEDPVIGAVPKAPPASQPPPPGKVLPPPPNLPSTIHPLAPIVGELATAGNTGAYYLDAAGDVYTAGQGANFWGAYGSLPPAARQGKRKFIAITAAPSGGYDLHGDDGTNYVFGPGSGEWDVAIGGPVK